MLVALGDPFPGPKTRMGMLVPLLPGNTDES